MKWLLIFAALLSFVMYGHAIRKLFLRDHGVDPRMKALQLVGTISALGHLWALWNSTVDVLRSVATLALYIAAILLFLAARRAVAQYGLTLAFSPDKPKVLLQSGIYARIRHPFYTAYTLTWFAGIVGAPSLTTVITTAMMCSAYWIAAQMEEKKFLSSTLAENYSTYRSKAGMFWPK